MLAQRAGRTRKDQIEPPLLTGYLTDLNCMDSGSRGIPLRTAPDRQLTLEKQLVGDSHPNLTETASKYLTEHRLQEDALLLHSLAVLHSTQYRADNFAGLKSNWPRVPLPAKGKFLVNSAELGRRVAALLDPEACVDGVTAAKVASELKKRFSYRQWKLYNNNISLNSKTTTMLYVGIHQHTRQITIFAR